MPLAHPPGEAQFDFGFADAVIGGVLQKVAYAAISLPYSNVRYVQAFPKECIETLQESLVRFFRFLDGDAGGLRKIERQALATPRHTRPLKMCQ